jgi:hypothetical protein
MFCDGAKLCFDTNALAKAGPATVELLKRELTAHLKTDIAAIRNVKSGWDDGAHWISFYQNEAAIKSSFMGTLKLVIASFSSLLDSKGIKNAGPYFKQIDTSYNIAGFLCSVNY